jgi:hypothetical protein
MTDPQPRRISRRAAVHRRLKENNFAYLLWGLLSFLVLIPILRLWRSSKVDAELLRDYLPVGFSLLVLVGVWGMQADKRIFRVGLALALAQVALAYIEQLLNLPSVRFYAALNALAFSMLSAYLGARHVFSFRQVDKNTLMGAICIYLLLGLMFALLYAMAAYLWPENAFNGIPPHNILAEFDAFLYFSFVTLTTAGYGDITPVNPLIRTLAFLEMITGQFYMAVLVAGLVGVFMSKHGPTE